MPEQANITTRDRSTPESEREREITSPSSVNAVECQPPAAIST
jgi:hypothetical protein